MFSYWAKAEDGHDLSRILNDHIAGVVAEYPRRFTGLGTLPMQDPKRAVAELERCVGELSLPGVEIGTNVNGKNLGDPEFLPVFEAAEDLGAAVFVHPWEMLGRSRTKKYWLSWLVGMPAETALAICSMIFGGVLERFPRLKVLFAHGGGSFTGTLGRIQHGFEVRPDLCAVDNDVGPREYLERFYVDSIVHEPRMLEFLVDKMGVERVALGSDYPFPLGELEPGKLIEESRFEETEKARMLHGTALEWLGLSKERFAGASEALRRG
jgi:aminocarboxymuconate-semialdehyde decarboxylase